MWLLRRETWSQGSQGGIFQLPEVHLGVQVGKFDPQDIYVGEQVQLLSGQSATVLEVSIRALLSGLHNSASGGSRNILQRGLRRRNIL